MYNEIKIYTLNNTIDLVYILNRNDILDLSYNQRIIPNIDELTITLKAYYFDLFDLDVPILATILLNDTEYLLFNIEREKTETNSERSLKLTFNDIKGILKNIYLGISKTVSNTGNSQVDEDFKTYNFTSFAQMVTRLGQCLQGQKPNSGYYQTTLRQAFLKGNYQVINNMSLNNVSDFAQVSITNFIDLLNSGLDWNNKDGNIVSILKDGICKIILTDALTAISGFIQPSEKISYYTFNENYGSIENKNSVFLNRDYKINKDVWYYDYIASSNSTDNISDSLLLQNINVEQASDYKPLKSQKAYSIIRRYEDDLLLVMSLIRFYNEDSLYVITETNFSMSNNSFDLNFKIERTEE